MVDIFRYPKRRLKKLIKEGEYDEAIELGKSLESKYSDDHDFMFIMGSVYFIVEDPKKALPYFEKSFQLDNSDVETLTLKTNVHLALEEKDKAIDCCKRILKLQPKNFEAQELLDKLENL
ncbi:MAG: tetratricopeptide repeat protein [Nitrosopumilus sp.]|nr:tetratricopeptide repeat protein [Nitrosopumilus sp.]MDH3737267.1 tetratricopeptide repeat protein [Nitrosopumilus sp.]MDH3822839.1 tetratricopeptide repeat protein [Nitrosopumilus sp.]MDH3834456.1 tetratricopeptide repeat protein [Nitrosopumilus sp.]